MKPLLKKQALITAGLTVATAISLTITLSNSFGRRQAAEAELDQLRRDIQNIHTLLEEQPGLLQELQQSIVRLRALKPILPATPDPYAWAYETISISARSAQITVNRLEGMESRNSPQGTPYELQVSVECNRRELIEFIRQLEENNPMLRVKQLSVTSPLGTEQLQQIKISIQWPAPLKIETATLEKQAPGTSPG